MTRPCAQTNVHRDMVCQGWCGRTHCGLHIPHLWDLLECWLLARPDLSHALLAEWAQIPTVMLQMGSIPRRVQIKENIWNKMFNMYMYECDRQAFGLWPNRLLEFTFYWSVPQHFNSTQHREASRQICISSIYLLWLRMCWLAFLYHVLSVVYLIPQKKNRAW